jgi:hypothetical protein
MVTISLKVSDELAGRLAPYQDRLPEIIELGLDQVEVAANGEANRDALKTRVLAALNSTGIVTAPEATVRPRPRIRRTPIEAGGPPASEIIIEERPRIPPK